MKKVSSAKLHTVPDRILLNEPVSSPGFQYGLVWPGKEEAMHLADSRPEGALIPMADGFPASETKIAYGTGDIFIEGDNLPVMQLLKPEYAGKVRFIYIDPPYNTGKQFTYRDHFRDEVRSGFPGEFNSNLAYLQHSPWLSMLYPRLVVARNLLREDGVIYVSIDDTEVHNLVLIMDEIFGEQNRAGIITWVKKKKGSHLSKKLRCMTEYILVYGKDISQLDLWGENAYTDKWQPLIKRINNCKILTFEAGVVETTLKKKSYPAGIYGIGGTAVELLDPIHIKNGYITNRFSIKARTVWTQEYLDRELALGTRVSIRSEGMGPNVFRHDQASKKRNVPLPFWTKK